ncbi:tyrosine-type recombinase/integrase [Sphingomonas aerolata]|jgi:integrase|uniref:tyrosine-type recombinase/integrase n=1 Tax=Sphingomonas aerolata TaxID=185951 RepID=UPI001E0EF320|nr:site-specific integrase [Sphingomonas aerolata]NII58107.1 integrase [Sphingomonas aerolata]
MPRPNQGPKLDYRADRGQFYITWSESGRSRKRSTGTGDREAAHIALAEFIRDRQQQSRPIGPSAPTEFPIDQALDLYGQQHAPTTEAPERIGYAIEALLPFWQQSTVGDITEATCRAYGRWRERSAGTIRKELGVLRAAVNFAHRHGRITTAPYVFLPEKPEGKSRWLTHSEAAALVRAARRARSTAGLSYATSSRGYLPLFILLALHTGARKEALLSLRWPQVDLDRGVIDLNPPGRRRTAKGRAVIPIPDRLMTLLRLARRRGTDLGYVLHQDGERILDIKRSFARACRDAGVAAVTPHTLRHTCGTWLAQRGVDLWEVAGWLGQTHARTTELYAHHHPDHFKAAKRAVDRRLS